MLIRSVRGVNSLPSLCKILRLQHPGIIKLLSTLPEVKTDTEKENQRITLENLRFKFPDFLPHPEVKYRNPLREKLERREMLRRRKVIDIPEFYVGSIMAVTTSDKYATDKVIRFVGICISKQPAGLSTKFILRNVIEHQGVEVLYHLYNPLIRSVEVLRLEKRLDDELFYLRDAPLEYSTFSFDMTKEYLFSTNEVPVNTIKVPINPRPWLQRYERMDLKGVILPELPKKFKERAEEVAKPWEKYDIMDEYRKTIPQEEQQDIFTEISNELESLTKKLKKEKTKKQTILPTKQNLF